MSNNAISSIQAVTPGIVPVSSVERPRASPSTVVGDPPRSEAAPLAEPPADLEQAVGQLNGYVASSRTDLQFRIDKDAGRVVVSIVDSESGQVLRQMPSEDALRIARYLESGSVSLLREQA